MQMQPPGFSQVGIWNQNINTQHTFERKKLRQFEILPMPVDDHGQDHKTKKYFGQNQPELHAAR